MESVQDAPKKVKQPRLVIEAPPKLRNESVAIADIDVQEFGSPPDTFLAQSVELFGITTPILLDGRNGGRYQVIDGRRRLLAAIQAGQRKVPARVVTAGDPDLIAPALTLAGNAHSSPNPVIECDAVENIMAKAGGNLGAVDIAKATRTPLKMVRRVLRVARLRFELRDGWRSGKFGTKVGEGACACDEMQQAELARRLDAAGTLTIEDVRDVRRSGVRAHQRTLPDDRWKARTGELLEKARREVDERLGGESRTVTLIREALVALEEEADD